jgi:hypothetical protein
MAASNPKATATTSDHAAMARTSIEIEIGMMNSGSRMDCSAKYSLRLSRALAKT